MRGKVFPLRNCAWRYRITPAYAGKRQHVPEKLHHDQDHPRLCGEKWYNNRRGELYVGSPPPMRGKGTVHGKNTRPWRITPAYAGKSS